MIASREKPNPVSISYSINRNDSLIVYDGIKTPLTSDIIQIHQQEMTIAVPQRKGVYQIKFYLESEGFCKWLKVKEYRLMVE